MTPLARLTPQELRILELLARGHSNREIGGKLEVQEKTVKFHVTNVLRKLGARNRVEAALLLKEKN
jgi:DNA-binding NarL/FixJ family response regulator